MFRKYSLYWTHFPGLHDKKSLNDIIHVNQPQLFMMTLTPIHQGKNRLKQIRNADLPTLYALQNSAHHAHLMIRKHPVLRLWVLRKLVLAKGYQCDFPTCKYISISFAIWFIGYSSHFKIVLLNLRRNIVAIIFLSGMFGSEPLPTMTTTYVTCMPITVNIPAVSN